MLALSNTLGSEPFLSLAYYCAGAGRVGQAYSCSPAITVAREATSAGVTASSASFAYALSGNSALPAGLSLNPSTGTISGTPTARSATNITVNVRVSLNGVSFDQRVPLSLYLSVN